MHTAPLARIFRRMVSRVASPVSVRGRRTVLEVTHNSLEPRLAPAALAAPTVDQTQVQYQPEHLTALAPPATTPTFNIDYTNAQTAINPQDPLRQVVVAEATRNYAPSGGTVYSSIVARYTTDGGTTWADFTNFGGSTVVPNVGGSTLIRDPSKDPASNPVDQLFYTQYESPTATITRDGQVYIGFIARGADSASGVVGVRRFDFSGAAPVTVNMDPQARVDLSKNASVAYRWFGGVNVAYYPNVASNPNVGSYTDPDTLTVLNDASATTSGGGGQVYVAWGGAFVQATGSTGPYNPNLVNVAVAPNLPAVTAGSAGQFFSGAVIAGGTSLGSNYVNPAFTGANRPQLAFTANNGVAGKFNPLTGLYDPVAAPGQLVTTYEGVGANNAIVGTTIANTANSVSVGGTYNNAAPGFENITDAIQVTGFPDFAQSTKFPIVVNGTPSAGLSLQNISVTLALQHASLSDVELKLVAPGATFGIDAFGSPFVVSGTAYNLVRAQNIANTTNTLQSEGAPYNVTGGLSGADLGSKFGANTGVTFSDDAIRRINDTGNSAPYIGTFRPDVAGSSQALSTAFMMRTKFGGLTLTDVGPTAGLGTWYLLVTDTRFSAGPRPTQFVKYAAVSINFAPAGTGFNQAVFTTAIGSSPVVATPGAIPTPNAPLTPVFGLPGSGTAFGYPTIGILGGIPGGFGPNVAVAVDHSLGLNVAGATAGASRAVAPGVHSGYLYVAYTAAVDMDLSNTISAGDDTDVFIASYDTSRVNPLTGQPVLVGVRRLNDDAASDNFSTGTRFQYQPALAVDPVTGTLAAAYYDARYDAGNSRYATSLSTSIDGGATFSPSVFVSQSRLAQDVITGKTLTLEPLPSNPFVAFPASANEYFGYTPIGVTAAGGKVNVTFTGNPNGPGSYVYTANTRTAAGPQVLYSDVGAIGSRTGTDAAGNTTLLPSQVQLDNPIAPAPARFYQYNTARQGQSGMTAAPPDATQLPATPPTPAAGTPLLDGIRVVFDRRVDPQSFRQASDVRVYYTDPGTGTTVELRTLYPGLTYRIDDLSAQTTGTKADGSELSPTGTGIGTGTLYTIGGVVQNIVTPDTDYVVRFVGASGNLVRVGLVGTYSYAVSPFVRDFHRNTVASQTANQTFGQVTLSSPTATAGQTVTPVTASGTAPVDPVTARTDNAGALKANPHLTLDSNNNVVLYGRKYTDPVAGTPGPFFGSLTSLNGVPVNSGTPDDDSGVTDIPITVPATGYASGSDLIARLLVQIDLVQTRRSQIVTQLVSPSGVVIPLTTGTGGDGAAYDTFAYESTVFDQYAAQPLAAGSNRYRGIFRPAGDLSQYVGMAITPGSVWYLRVVENQNTDNQFGQTGPNPLGYLRSWSLTFVPGTLIAPTATDNDLRRGNYLDQNGDATAWEPVVDSYRAPKATAPYLLTDGPYQPAAGAYGAGAGLFAQGPFDRASLPLVLAGPRVIGASTSAAGGRNLSDQVYLNVPADVLYVRFDRAVDLASFAGTTVTVTTPEKTIVLPASAVTAGATADEVKITFPSAFTRVGGYTVAFGNTLKSTAGDYVDVNQNAGVDRLFGGNATSATLVSTVSYPPSGVLQAPVPIRSAPVAGTNGGFTVTGETVAEMDIPVTDAFQIAQDLVRFPNARIQLALSISDSPHDPATASLYKYLTADLVAPDGTRIRLLTGQGGIVTGPGTVTSSILFDDTALSPIGSGFNPGVAASYSPQIPLARLLGKWSLGTWKVVVTNTGLFRTNAAGNLPVDVGQIVSARLILAGAVTPKAGPGNPGVSFDTGLGEARADQTTVGFRVFNQIPTSAESSQVWQPVGQPNNNQANVGRVSAVTVDPSDPTGNTVFAAGASGGVWKTTNFLTNDPDGPTWTPLTDFGVGTSINVSSISVFTRPLAGGTALDPSRTVVFALTGEGDWTNQPAGNTQWTTPGVGVLRSEDGGKTWELLDSTTNVGATGAPLPIGSGTRDRKFVGASGFKIVTDPVAFQATDKYDSTKIAVYMAVTGGQVATGTSLGAAGLWRSLDGGRNWVQLRAGSATDVALAPIPTGSDPSLQTLYAAFRSDNQFILDAGVYFTAQATNTPAVVPGGPNGSLTRLNGGGGTNRIVAVQGGGNQQVQVGPDPVRDAGPSIASTRITLAVPAVGNDPLANSLYRGWLYVTAANADGGSQGLWLTKDFGTNWTKVRTPDLTDYAGNFWGQNNEFGAQVPDNNVIPSAFADSSYTANVAFQRSASQLGDTPRQYIPRPGSVFSPYGSTPRAQGQGTPGQDPWTAGGTGNRALSLAVDPLNPAVVYLGGDRSIRVDTSVVKDPQAYYYFDNTQGGPAGSSTLLTTSGGVNLIGVPAIPASYGIETTNSPRAWGVIVPGLADPTTTNNGLAPVYTDKYGQPAGFVNLSRDPGSPYSPSVIQVYNAASFSNNGENAKIKPFDNILFGTYDVSSIVPFVDPQTGRTRLIYGTAGGVYTGVDDGRGYLTTAVGYDGVRGRYLGTDTQSSTVVTGPRNGNLQIAQDYAGALQPTRLAADIAGALFYAVTQDNGYPVSTGSVLQTGNTSTATSDWPGTGMHVVVDQTGTGTAYQYRLPSSTGTPVGNGQFGNVNDFIRAQLPGSDQSGSGKGATNNLITAADNPFQNQGQWRDNDNRRGGGDGLAINPLTPTGLLVSASPTLAGGTGNVYRSTDGGGNWTLLGAPAGGVYLRSLAFGGVDPAQPSNLNNYVLAGSDDGRVFFTTTGTAPMAQFNFTGASLNGRAVQRVVPNPRPGAADFYVLTDRGVYYATRTSRTTAAAALVDVTYNLYSDSLTRTTDSLGLNGTAVQTTPALKDVAGNQLDLTSLAVDWRYVRPVLYAGGQGGVFRLSLTTAATTPAWTLFPNVAGATTYPVGGFFPNARVTDLDLSLGAINPATGLPNLTLNPSGLNNNVGGQNLLLASTFGRGQFVIRVDPADKSLPPFAPGAFESGPRVSTIAFTGPDNTTRLNPVTAPKSTQKFDIVFDSPVDPLTITPKDITILLPGETDPANKLAVASVVLDTGVLAGQPDPRNRYTVTLAVPTTVKGLFFVQVGSSTNLSISDLAGNRMNQNGNQINGEQFDSPNGDDTFSTYLYLNDKDNSLLVSGLASKLSTQAPSAFTVTAITLSGATDTTFAGKVNLSSTDTNILLSTLSGAGVYPSAPATLNYTFTGAGSGKDNGQHTFTATFRSGKQITDAFGTLVSPLVGKFQTVSVDLDPVNPSSVLDFYNPGQIGTSVLNARVEVTPAKLRTPQISTWDPQTVVANVVDYNGNRLPAFGGTIGLDAPNDPLDILPPAAVYTPGASNGTATFTNVIFRTKNTQTLVYTGKAVDGIDPLTVSTKVLNAVLTVSGLGGLTPTAPISTYDQQALTVTVRSAVPGDGNKPLVAFNTNNGLNLLTGTNDARVLVDTFDSANAVKDDVTPRTVVYLPGGNGAGGTEIVFKTQGTTTRTVGLTAPIGVDPLTLTPTVGLATFKVVTPSGAVLDPDPTKAPLLSTWNPQALKVSVISPYTNRVLDRFTGTVGVKSATDPLALAVQPDSDSGNNQSPITGAGQSYLYVAGSAGSRTQTVLFRTGGPTVAAPLPQSLTFSGPVGGVADGTVGYKVVNAVFNVIGLPATGEVATAGVPLNLTIAVADQVNNLATLTSFTGQTALGSDDPQVVLPPNPFVYLPINNGSKSLTATFKTAGNKSLTVATSNPNPNGVESFSGTVPVQAAEATRLAIGGFPSPVVAGTTGKQVTVTAFDQFGNVATGFRGTVQLTSTDLKAGGLPTTYAFTAGDAGQHKFDVVLKTAGTQTIVAADASGNLSSVSESGIVVTPATASQFTLFGFPGQTIAGVPHALTLKASDPYGNTATDFTGTVKFSTTDGKVSAGDGLPADYVFSAADLGQHTFPAVELRTAGPQSITATSGSLSSSQAGIQVFAAPASTYDFSLTSPSGPPYSIPAGGSVGYRLVAKDRFGNTDMKYAGTVQFTSTDPNVGGLPLPYTFTAANAGQAEFSSFLNTAGVQTITAADASGAAVGSSPPITVQPNPANRLLVAGNPSTLTAGDSGLFTVSLFDNQNNPATTFTGTVALSSSNPTARFALASDRGTPVTSYTFTAADAGFRQFVVSFSKAGQSSVVAAAPGVTGNSVSIQVQAGQAAKFAVGEFPTPIDPGTARLARVTALDQFGNTADQYAGQVRVSSSDPAAVLPAQGKLTGGTGFFLVTLNTPGSQSITASDTLNAAVLGSQSGITVTGTNPNPQPQPPQVSALPATTLTAGGTTAVPFTVDTFALGTVADALVYSATSSNPVLVPASGLVFSGSGRSRSLKVTASAGVTGSAVVTVTVTDPATNLFSTQTLGLTVNPVPQPPLPPPSALTHYFTASTDVGALNRVTVYNPDGSVLGRSEPFAPGFSNGTRTATVRQASGKEIIAAVPGPGRQTEVKLLDPVSGAVLRTLEGFESSFSGGLFVAAGDVNGDGYDDIAISADQGGGGRVKVYDGQAFTLLADFYGIDDPSFRGGARVAFGDVSGDGTADLVVSAGFGGGPRVALFNGKTVRPDQAPTRLVGDFYVFEQTLRNGVYVTAGDLNGDGYAELIAGGGPGGGPRVFGLDGRSIMQGQPRTAVDFFAGDPDNRDGVRLAVKNLDGDQFGDIVTGQGGGGTAVRVYYGADLLRPENAVTPPAGIEFEELPGTTGGVFVG